MAVTGRGLIGTGSATSAGTTITVTNTTGAVIPAGTFIHITGAWDNINSVTAPTITSSTVGGVAPTANHGTAIGSGVTTTAGSGVWHQCFRVLTTGTIASGATIATLTSNQSAVKRAAHAEGFNNCTATLRGTVTTGTSAAGTPTVTTTGTALVIGDLAIGSISNENSGQATADADTTGGAWPPIVGIATSGGAAGTNMNSGSQYKILTATGTQTFNPTCPATDAVVCVYSLVPVPEPTFTQAAYRLYADGTESGSTALAAQDTAPEVDVAGGDVNVQLRVRLQSTNAGAVAATDDYQLQYDKNASGTWTNVSVPGEHLADSYPSVNSDFNVQLNGLSERVSQSFLGNGENLNRTAFWLRKIGSPTPDLSSTIYTHSGTFGTSSIAAGALQSSTPVAASSVAASYSMISFTFPGTRLLTAGTPYVIGVGVGTSGTIDVSNYFDVGQDFSSGTHPGNYAAASTPQATSDLIFELYTTPVPAAVVPYNSASLTDSAATTNRLGAGSGSFIAGEVSEDGLVDDYAPTVNNYTELLYSITLDSAGLTDGDTLTFRVLRNGATTGLTYTATPTIDIGGGVPNIPGTALIEIPLAATAVGTVTTPPVVTGTALITSTVDVTVAGTVIAEIVTGTTLISSAIDVTAVATVTHFVTGTAALSQSVETTVAGTRTVNGTALIEITGNASATAGARTINGTATIDVAVSLDVAGTVVAEVVNGTALVTASVDVTAAGTVVAEIVNGTALVTESVVVTAAGTRAANISGAALIAQSVAVDVAGTVVAEIVAGIATLTTSVDVTAIGTPGVSGTALVTTSVDVAAAGVPTTYGTAAITESIAITASGTPGVTGTALVTESVAVTAAGTPGVTGTAALTESVAVTVVGTPTTYGTALISQSVALTSIGTTAGEAVGTALIAIPTAITVTGTRTVAATAAISVPVAVAVVGRRDVRGTAAITMAATVTVAGTRSGIVSGTGQVAVSVAVSVAATPVRYGTATLTADVQIAAVGVSFQVGAGTALITSSVVVTATGRWSARDAYVATWTLTYTGTLAVAARATADFDYSGGCDTGGTATVDHDYADRWELV